MSIIDIFKFKPKLLEVPKPPRYPLGIIKVSRNWEGIVWHHSAIDDRHRLDDWTGIRKYHTSYRVDFKVVDKDEFERRIKKNQGKYFELPWRDIGYHAGTEYIEDDIVFQWGRALNTTGAHAGVAGVSNHYNRNYLGLCCVGNFDDKPPHDDLWEFNLKVTRSFMDLFNIQKENVIGHREVYDRLKIPRQKTCPGRMWNMDQFRSQL